MKISYSPPLSNFISVLELLPVSYTCFYHFMYKSQQPKRTAKSFKNSSPGCLIVLLTVSASSGDEGGKVSSEVEVRC